MRAFAGLRLVWLATAILSLDNAAASFPTFPAVAVGAGDVPLLTPFESVAESVVPVLQVVDGFEVRVPSRRRCALEKVLMSLEFP